MFRLSNSLIGLLNLVLFFLSIPVLAGGVWLSFRAATDCDRFLHRPLLFLGIFILVVSLAGLVGACCRVSWLLWFYLLVTFLLILLLLAFTVFGFVVTYRGHIATATEDSKGEQGMKEYRLGDYSNWLRKKVDNEKNWEKIRSCISSSRACKRLEEMNISNLSPLQSGCCKPPIACNFTYRDGTTWDKPLGFSSNGVSDCNTWQNDQLVLCYDCQSCKASVLANSKYDWKKVAVINAVVLAVLIFVYSIGCCAFKNNTRDDAHRKRKGHV